MSETSQSINEAPLPWTDCKVAFDIRHPEAAWRLKVGDLPSGWELVETDGSGARDVAVFRVPHIPVVADGASVVAALRKAGAL